MTAYFCFICYKTGGLIVICYMTDAVDWWCGAERGSNCYWKVCSTALTRNMGMILCEEDVLYASANPE